MKTSRIMSGFFGVLLAFVCIGCQNPSSDSSKDDKERLPSTIVFSDGAAVTKLLTSGTYTNTISGDGTGAITYTSGTPTTATVDSNTGEVKLLASGTTVITATKEKTKTHSAITGTYTLTVLEYIFSDDFNRADTTSPSVGSTLWKDLYAPNTISISGNMLRFGTANAQQTEMTAASKLNLSSDFSISVDFKNLRFNMFLVFDNLNKLGFMPLETNKYYILYPTSSPPVALDSEITNALAADTWYTWQIQKVGMAITSKILQGTIEKYSNIYTFTATEDFSSVTFKIGGGGTSGWGTGDVFIDNLIIKKL